MDVTELHDEEKLDGTDYQNLIFNNFKNKRLWILLN